MPATAKIEFPNGRPRAYVLMWIITACTFVTNMVVWYWIPKYSSTSTVDEAHPFVIRFNGVIIYVSRFSDWLFKGSFIAALIAILALVGLGFYYRSIGVGVPIRDQVAKGPIELKLDGK